MLLSVEGGKPENPRKTLGTRREPTTNSTHIWHQAGIEPRLLVGGKRSRHCAIPAHLTPLCIMMAAIFYICICSLLFKSMICYISTRVDIITHFLPSSCDVDGSFSPPTAPSSVVSLGSTTKQRDESFLSS